MRRDVIARALASELKLEVANTRYRGHAAHLAESAAREGVRLVLTLGGDGTVNEVVNGLLRALPPEGEGFPRPPGSADPGPGEARLPAGAAAAERPALAALPGGSANVFVRALGLPADPVEATGHVLASLIAGSERSIGLGLADDRYFAFNAGLGLDAEVVRAVEGLRADGQSASAALYLWTTIRHFFAVTNRRSPALSACADSGPEIGGLFLGIVSNTAPWTYLGQRPVNASPRARFDAGLDLFGLRSLGVVSTLNALRQMLDGSGLGPRGKHTVSLHDRRALTLRACRPVAFQVDGEYVGERELVRFRAVPKALRVIA